MLSQHWSESPPAQGQHPVRAGEGLFAGHRGQGTQGVGLGEGREGRREEGRKGTRVWGGCAESRQEVGS